MQHLDLYDVLAVAARVMKCETGTVLRRTDLELVDQVLEVVTRSSGDLADAAAVLLSGLIRRRPFQGPNRVVAVAVTLQFVALNGADLELEPADEFDAWLDQIKAAELTPVRAADHLRSRMSGQHAAPHSTFGKEAISWEEIHMFERFSEQARHALVLAQEEARALNHNYIGTEHVLLGLIREGDGVAAKVLSSLGISAAAVRAVVESLIGRGQSDPVGHIPFTPRAKTVLEFSLKESVGLGHNYIGTEHILLGLIREGEGVAAKALTKLGAELDKVRQQVIDILSHRQRSEEAVRGFLENAEQSGNWVQGGRRRYLLAELAGLLDENERLHEEVTRLREKLRRNNLDPDA